MAAVYVFSHFISKVNETEIKAAALLLSVRSLTVLLSVFLILLSCARSAFSMRSWLDNMAVWVAFMWPISSNILWLGSVFVMALYCFYPVKLTSKIPRLPSDALPRTMQA